MQIIKRGKKPEHTAYRFSCPQCETEMIAKLDEFQVSFWRNDYIFGITCPVCSRRITLDKDKMEEAGI